MPSGFSVKGVKGEPGNRGRDGPPVSAPMKHEERKEEEEEEEEEEDEG